MEFSKLVPQLFFDLIARVIPGAVMLIGLLIAGDFSLTDETFFPFKSSAALQERGQAPVASDSIASADGSATSDGLAPNDRALAIYDTPAATMVQLSAPGVEGPPGSDTGLTFSFFLLFFLASYIAGHLLDPLSTLLERMVSRLSPSYLGVLTEIINGTEPRYPPKISGFFSDLAEEYECKENEDRSHEPNSHHISLLFIWLDWLRLEKENVGERIVKIRAEFKMQSQLAAGSILVAVVHLCAVGVNIVGLNRPLVVVSLLVAVLAIFNYRELFHTFQLSIINNYYASKKPETRKQDGTAGE